VTAGRLTLGTAGHIDHGKTRLVEALTGTNTDRLPEERKRGISIALGYAQLELPDGTRLSVIDVPGHDRFVRTMVAGATGIDLFLLVVDAAEGPKPQTYEHLEILRLLGVERGVVAVTKIDTTDAERLQASIASVRELLPDLEIVPVSSVTGEGLPLLLAALARAADTVAVQRRQGPTRLYVDRVFSLPGAGPVVTGTLWSGSIEPGDRLDVLPAGFEVRVRSVEVHGEPVARADAGQRVAVAISAERRRSVARGDALVETGSYAPTYRLDVVLDEADGVSLPNGAQVTVCHGTTAVAARVVRAGERFAQLRLSRPLVAARGDRLVLRQETTVGGGRILDPAPPRRLDEARLAQLERGDPESLLAAIVDAPVPLDAVRIRLQLSDGELAEGLRSVERAGSWVCSRSWLAATRARTHATLAAREGELDPGLAPSALLGDAPWAGEIAKLLSLESREGKLYVPGQAPRADNRGDGVGRRLAEAGLTPVEIEDAGLARQLERDGRLVRLSPTLAISPEAYDHYKSLVVEECEQAGTVTLARFRDRAEVPRRIAQLLLERFDVDRVTLRVGDERRLRRASHR
jgi:selenocysteine-specific elongation factor